MSGFIGIVSLSRKAIDIDLFDGMIGDVGNFCQTFTDRYISPDQRLALARVHKGIINPEKQPCSDSVSDTDLFIHGEVFNDDFDFDKQPESILKAYLQEGQNLLRRLNGSFALIISEAGQGRLQVAVDRLATVPIYYAQKEDFLYFGSDLRPLLRGYNSDLRINLLAVENFLACGFILDGNTLLQDIKMLRPGELMTVENGSMAIKKYWQFEFAQQRDTRPQAELEEELFGLCAQAVRRRTKGNFNFAIPLSGGYDSRAILYFYLDQNPGAVMQTVSWGNEESVCFSDAWIARHLSKHLRTNHAFYQLNAEAISDNFRSFVRMDEGRTDAIGNYPEQLKVFKDIRNHLGVDILLRGNEIFGVRRKVSRNNNARFLAHMNDLSFFPHSFQYLRPDILKLMIDMGKDQMNKIYDSSSYPDPIDWKDYLYITQRYSGYQSPLTHLKRHVIEERNPFLDTDIFEFVHRLPAPLRVSKMLFKSAMSNLLPGFTDISLSRTVSLINWDYQIATDRRLMDRISTVLFERRNGFDEIMNEKALRQFVENAMVLQPMKPRSLTTRANRKLRERFDKYELEVSTEIFRLMILKSWADEFLNGDFRID